MAVDIITLIIGIIFFVLGFKAVNRFRIPGKRIAAIILLGLGILVLMMSIGLITLVPIK